MQNETVGIIKTTYRADKQYELIPGIRIRFPEYMLQRIKKSSDTLLNITDVTEGSQQERPMIDLTDDDETLRRRTSGESTEAIVSEAENQPSTSEIKTRTRSTKTERNKKRTRAEEQKEEGTSKKTRYSFVEKFPRLRNIIESSSDEEAEGGGDVTTTDTPRSDSLESRNDPSEPPRRMYPSERRLDGEEVTKVIPDQTQKRTSPRTSEPTAASATGAM